MPLTKKQKAVINIAKFLKSQSLYLLGKLEELDLGFGEQWNQKPT